MPASEPVHERVELPVPPVMLEALSVQARLVELVVTGRVTVPLNPLMGLTVIVDEPATPVFNATFVGFAEIVKSCGAGVVT